MTSPVAAMSGESVMFCHVPSDVPGGEDGPAKPYCEYRFSQPVGPSMTEVAVDVSRLSCNDSWRPNALTSIRPLSAVTSA